MSVAVISGSAGLVGSVAAEYFAGQGRTIVGIDNDLRRHFFGEEASTLRRNAELAQVLASRYEHHALDIRDADAMKSLFRKYGSSIELVVHAAAQPSHDWAARDPHADFSVNALGTLNLLEATRQFSPDAVFAFTSTNKVYGDTPNRLPLIELETRWEIAPGHRYQNGISEDMSIDRSLHSLFGASKVAADILVQEYGRYFGLATGCFRAGCITGPHHAGAQLHGFLAYLMKCTVTGTPYTVLGYGGKQVRDNIHAIDLVMAIDRFYQEPHSAAVYNIGGGRHSNCSVLEAIRICEATASRPLNWTYRDDHRTGDHQWWISDIGRFAGDYPGWTLTYDIERICREVHALNAERWQGAAES